MCDAANDAFDGVTLGYLTWKERNLKNFQLPTFLTSATFRAAPREDDSYSPSTSLMTPQDRHESLQAA
jgi:hypothetical protein